MFRERQRLSRLFEVRIRTSKGVYYERVWIQDGKFGLTELRDWEELKSVGRDVAGSCFFR